MYLPKPGASRLVLSTRISRISPYISPYISPHVSPPTRCVSPRTLHPYLPYISLHISPHLPCISPNQVRLASYLALSAALPGDVHVRAFPPLLRAVLAGLLEARTLLDLTRPYSLALALALAQSLPLPLNPYPYPYP